MLKTYNDLDHLAGTWSEAEAREFEEYVAPFEQIDEEILADLCCTKQRKAAAGGFSKQPAHGLHGRKSEQSSTSTLFPKE